MSCFIIVLGTVRGRGGNDGNRGRGPGRGGYGPRRCKFSTISSNNCVLIESFDKIIIYISIRVTA